MTTFQKLSIKIISFVFFVVVQFNLFAQNFHGIKVEGCVVDYENNKPVKNFSIKVDSLELNFQNGSFEIEIDKIRAKIKFSSSGYFSKEIVITDSSNFITVYLFPENIEIQEISIKAFESSSKISELAGQIDVIINKNIINEPSFSAASIINRIPGVWMQSGSLNTNRLTIRGIGSRSQYSTNKIRAYYGDIPLTNGAGETTIEDIETDEISTIEIIKGPASGFYGSGLGGVLLFNPKKNYSNHVSQKVEIGSFNTIKSLTKVAFLNYHSSSSLVYSRLNSDGYRENNQTLRHNVLFQSSYSYNRTKIDILTSLVRTEAFIPSSLDEKVFNESPEKAAASWGKTKGYEDYKRIYSGVSVKHSFTDSWYLSTSLFGYINKNNELRPFNILKEENNYYGFRTYLQKKVNTDFLSARILVGNEYFNEIYNWNTFENISRSIGNILSYNREKRFYNNLFLLSELILSDKINLMASLNINTTSYNYTDLYLQNGDQSGKYVYKPIFSPRFLLVYSPLSMVKIYSTLSHGFSPPSLEETLMPGGSRNLNIKPETGWNYELGFKYSANNSLTIEMSAYYMKVYNLLVSRRIGNDEYQGINAGKTNHPGIDFSLDYRFVDLSSLKSNLIFNSSVNDFRFSEFFDKDKDYSGNKLTGIASVVSNFAINTQLHKGFFLNINIQTVGKIPLNDDNSKYSEPYIISGIMAGYEKNFNKFLIGLYFGSQNLADTKYASMLLINAVSSGNQLPRYYYPGLPRNFKSGINLKYSF